MSRYLIENQVTYVIHGHGYEYQAQLERSYRLSIAGAQRILRRALGPKAIVIRVDIIGRTT